jgi:hypothetical protein
MVVGGSCKVLLLLVFSIFILSRVSEICAQSAKSLYVARRNENTNIHIFERSETQNSLSDSPGVWKSDVLTGHSLYKRSAAVESNITTNVRLHFCNGVVCVKYAVHYFGGVRVLT